MNNYRYIKNAIRKMHGIRTGFANGELDEQAVPSYLDGNLLSRQVFISRLLIAMRFASGLEQKRQCLDFGCGSGIMLPWLASRFDKVNGVDLDLRFAQRFCGENRSITLAESPAAAGIDPHSQDLILALDVLEHMHDPVETIRDLAVLLRPQGIIIISGPTENWLYRLGRRIVGFDGHYHHTNIHAIRQAACRILKYEKKAKVIPVLTLFEILCFSIRP